jgi:elongator complex protein 3
MVKTTFQKIIQGLVKNRIKNSSDLARFKRRLAKEYKVPCPSNVSLLKTYHELVKNKRIKSLKRIENLLRTRPIRSLSGIVNVSVLTKPYPCPGKCIYCPSQKGAPKSYLKNEPAVMRAILNKYDPYKQVKMRIRALKNTGHPTDKVELRIIGGTWSFYPKRYQTWFIKRCFDACNNVQKPGLSTAQRLNEKAKHRIVGLSVETRPDFITEKEIKRLRQLGVTQVELGVQSIYDNVLRLNKRGHGVKAIIKATKFLKNAGFKICYQMMPNLPGSSPARDLKMFKELFANPRFRPDLLKIYPCAILRGTILYQWWKRGKYKPYTDNQLISLVKKIKNGIPYYVRIQRITRDIPSHSIAAGPAKISNLRQMIAGKVKCRCIRCREVKADYNRKEKLYLFRQDYKASDGKEIFLTFENKKRDELYSLLRLRFTPQNAAIIREVHTYGQLHPINEPPRPIVSPQHKGWGKKLIKEAEKIAKKEFGQNKIAVISGIGVRDYYRKLGYKLKNTYMVKEI